MTKNERIFRRGNKMRAEMEGSRRRKKVEEKEVSKTKLSTHKGGKGKEIVLPSLLSFSRERRRKKLSSEIARFGDSPGEIASEGGFCGRVFWGTETAY